MPNWNVRSQTESAAVTISNRLSSMCRFPPGSSYGAVAMTNFNVPPGFLEIELTESVLMQDTKNFTFIVGELQKLGVSIALDDFGTGFSSLSYLNKFSFNTIKIDKSFINSFLGFISKVLKRFRIFWLALCCRYHWLLAAISLYFVRLSRRHLKLFPKLTWTRFL